MDPQQNQVPMESMPEKKSFGPLIGIIVIIAVIVIGGLYFWSGMFSSDEAVMPSDAEVTPTEVSSTEVSSAEIDNLEAELDASMSGFTEDNFSDIESALVE